MNSGESLKQSDINARGPLSLSSPEILMIQLLRVLLRALVLFFFFSPLCGYCQEVAQESTPEANPGRPTVSTPATLTPVGYLQFENGGLYAAQSPEFNTRFGITRSRSWLSRPGCNCWH